MSSTNKIFLAIFIFFVFSVAAALISPPDIVSDITILVGMTILFSILVFVISRLKMYIEASEKIKILEVILVCVFTIGTFFLIQLYICSRSSMNRDNNFQNVQNYQSDELGVFDANDIN